MAAATKQIEEYLQKIRRLPSNKMCANCGVASRLGFGAVCVKYQTFVCDLCKSSHQSYSHRTKSVTMSTWTMDEVKALDEKNGGGNNCCRAKWFGKMTEAEQARYTPKEGASLDDYKKFVHMVYEEGRWLDANGKPSTSSSTAATSSASEVAKKKAPTPVKPMMSPSNVTAASKAPKKATPEEDLLILDFDATITVTPSTTPPAAPTSAPPSSAASAVQADWGSFTTSSPTIPVSKPASSLSDDWTFQAAPSVATMPPTSQQQQPAFQPFASAAKPPMMPTSTPFALPQQQPPFGFPSTVPMTFNIPLQPNSPTPPFGISAQRPPQQQIPFAPVAQMGAGLVNDPFSHLHSYNSAPSAINRTNSANSAPAIGVAAPLPNGLVRASTTGTPSNDPFAGLF